MKRQGRNRLCPLLQEFLRAPMSRSCSTLSSSTMDNDCEQQLLSVALRFTTVDNTGGEMTVERVWSVCCYAMNIQNAINLLWAH